MYPIASEEKYQDGQYIFSEGSSGDWVYVVLSGAVEILKNVGDQKFTLEILSEGEVFGELSFIGNIKRTASAKAVGVTTIGLIDRDYLYSEFNKLSSPMRAILVSIVMRFKKMLERATGFSERRQPRITKTIKIKYKDRKSFIDAYTDNLSLGGLFIRTDKPLEKGEVFLMKLFLPDMEESLDIKCEVVWNRKEEDKKGTKGPGMGVRFVEMNQKDEDIFQNYIKKA